VIDVIITIDGPTASGKSSIAKALAQRLNFYYLNTGLLYRAVTYTILSRLQQKMVHGVEQWLAQATEKDFDFITDLSYEYRNNEPHVIFQHQDITEHLFDATLGQYTSIVSLNTMMRNKLLVLQRTIGQKNNIVVDGRDCGSVVFPNADYKFFLTADLDVRVQRVLLDPKRNADANDLAKIKADLQERDQRDRERAVAPLVVPDGAMVIDSSAMTFEQTIDLFLKYIQKV